MLRHTFASRYLINTSMKHHFTANLDVRLFKILQPSLSYRFVERPTNSYQIVDAKLSAKINSFSIFVLANNIFNASYFENNFVLMPKGNMMFGLNYSFK